MTTPGNHEELMNFSYYKHLNRAFLFEIRLYQMISDDFRSFSFIFMNFYRQLSIKTDDDR